MEETLYDKTKKLADKMKIEMPTEVTKDMWDDKRIETAYTLLARVGGDPKKALNTLALGVTTGCVAAGVIKDEFAAKQFVKAGVEAALWLMSEMYEIVLRIKDGKEKPGGKH